MGEALPYVRKTNRRPSITKRARVTTITCGTVAVALTFGGLYLKQQETIAANAAAAAEYTPSAVQQGASVEQPRVAMLGDSYTDGAGASQAHDTFTYKVATTMGWDLTTYGQGGTGYTNPGQAAENESVFISRLPDVISSNPEIVIVQGGTNDTDPAATQAAAAEVFAEIKAGLPEATIIAMGPVLVPGYDEQTLRTVSAAVGDAAEEHGVPYIDPASGGWLADADVFPDGVHPNDTGHAELSMLLASELTKLDL